MSTAESALLSESTRTAEQLHEVTARAAAMTGAEGAGLAVWQGNGLITVASKGSNSPSIGVVVHPSSFAGQCFETGTILVCNDIDGDSRVDANTCRALNVGSMVAAPIWCGGKKRGVLAVFASQRCAFTRSKIDLVKTMAIVAGELLTAAKTNPGADAAPQLPVPETDIESGKTIEAAASESSADDSVSQKPAQSKILVIKPAGKATPESKPLPEKMPAAVPSVPPVAKTPPVPSDVAAQDTRGKGPAKAEGREKSTPRPSNREAKVPLPPAPGAAKTPTTPSEAASAPQFTLEPPSSGNRGILGVAAIVIVVAAVACGAFLLRGRSTKPATTAAQSATAISPVTPPASSEATAPVQDASSSATSAPTASSSTPAQPRAVTTPAAQAPKETLKAAPAPLWIHAPTPRTRGEQGDVAPPNVQLASGTAPIALSARTYVPRAPSTSVTPAVALRRVAPVYPAGSGAKGTVLITASIQKDGRIGKVQVSSGHPALRAAAVSAVKQWLYKPAYLNGQPVESSVDIKVEFGGR